MIQQFAEELLDLVRMGGGADIEILRSMSQEQIADAAAHEAGEVVVLVQPVQHPECVGVDLLARDRVLPARHDHRLAHWPALYQLHLEPEA